MMQGRGGLPRWVKPGVWLAALAPLATMVWLAFHDGLGANPVQEIQFRTGTAALVLLLVTLAVTPLRRITGWNAVIRLRRTIGLFTFFYVVLHAAAYFIFDQSLSLGLILEDVRKHPRVGVGFVAFLLLIPLALTSTDGMIRRLGGKRWARLHQLIYVIGAAAVIHYLMIVKRDIRLPVAYASGYVLLMAARVLFRRSEQGRRVPRAADAAPAALETRPGTPTLDASRTSSGVAS
jgi:sulfoxide reductase heme-binding subunit YedZ